MGPRMNQVSTPSSNRWSRFFAKARTRLVLACAAVLGIAVIVIYLASSWSLHLRLGLAILLVGLLAISVRRGRFTLLGPLFFVEMGRFARRRQIISDRMGNCI